MTDADRTDTDTDTDLGRLVPGEPATGRQHELHFTRTLRHPPEKVWRALTEPAHLQHWFPCEIRGERRQGAPLEFVFDGGDADPIAGVLAVWAPPTDLEYRWGSERLCFTLADDGEGGTVLTFVNTFDDLGKGARDAAGWHVCLEALERELADEPPITDTRPRWEQVHARYVEAFGPEASTIGPPPGR
jgi:uncharacterized protein YndB with AHSA1/START domain